MRDRERCILLLCFAELIFSLPTRLMTTAYVQTPFLLTCRSHSTAPLHTECAQLRGGKCRGLVFFLYLSLTPWATFYINTAAENLLESQSAIALRRPWLFAGKCWRRKFKKSFQTPGGNDSAELRWELFWHGSTSLWQWLSRLPAFCVRQFLAAEFKYLVCTAEQRDYRHLWEIYMQPARRRCSARCIISIVSGNLSTMNYLLSAEATGSEVLQKKKLHGLYFLFSC
jgi:hypothetical protein